MQGNDADMVTLTEEQRKKVTHWGVPGKKALPLPDESHTRDAWREVDQTQGLTDSERSEARRIIVRRAHELGMDTKGWHAAELVSVELEAMSVELPQTPGHPNKRPFSGILTKVDQPSDGPPGG